jgi:hypothetical protein
MKIKSLLTLASLLFLIACGNDDPVEDPTSFEEPAKLEVQVRLCLNQACDTLVQVPGAQIFLFENEQYRSEGSPIAYDGTTNGFGKVRFETLDSLNYWITIKMPNPDGRSQFEQVKTPKRTTTYVDVVFEKE